MGLGKSFPDGEGVNGSGDMWVVVAEGQHRIEQEEAERDRRYANHLKSATIGTFIGLIPIVGQLVGGYKFFIEKKPANDPMLNTAIVLASGMEVFVGGFIYLVR